MAQFPSERHLTSWVGVCPGNNRSARQQKSGAIRRGNRCFFRLWCRPGGLRRVRGALFSRKSVFLPPDAAQRPQTGGDCRGSHSALRSVCITLSRGEPSCEPLSDFPLHAHSKKVQHHLRKLAQLGVDVSGLKLPPHLPLPSSGGLIDSGRPASARSESMPAEFDIQFSNSSRALALTDVPSSGGLTTTWEDIFEAKNRWLSPIHSSHIRLRDRSSRTPMRKTP